MKKIVIHGCTGLKNSGDEAILQTIIQQYGEEYDITVISRAPEYTRQMHPGVKVIPDEKQACQNAIRQCDLFLLGGGGLLQDETTVFNVSVWLRYLKYAKKLGKKICVYANSVGPVKVKWNRYLVRKHLKDVDLITLRDKDSALLLKELGITQQVQVTADPVFSLKWSLEERNTVQEKQQEASQMAQKESARKDKGEYVCMALRHWFDMIPFIPVKICNKFGIRSAKNKKRYERYIQTMAETTEYINRELGYDVVFVSFLYGRDDKVARDILAQVKETAGRRNQLVTDEYLTPNEVLNVIAHARFLVGMRLHSVIYAIRTHTPMVILDYSAKVRAMAKLNRLSDYCVDVNTMDTQGVKEAIRRMLAKEEELKNIICEQEKIMQEQEQKNKALLSQWMK